jgi:hypothetical protein
LAPASADASDATGVTKRGSSLAGIGPAVCSVGSMGVAAPAGGTVTGCDEAVVELPGAAPPLLLPLPVPEACPAVGVEPVGDVAGSLGLCKDIDAPLFGFWFWCWRNSAS